MRKLTLTAKIMVLLGIVFTSLATQGQEYYLFAGTYTSGKSEGIYVFRFDAKTGKVVPTDTLRNIDNPSYLVVSGNGNFVYAVSENGGSKPGMINALAFNQKTGKLRLLNSKPSKGDYPCYITVSKDNKWVMAGNYGGGNLVAYATAEDGSLTDRFQVIAHTGMGVDKNRQEGPHVHATIFTPDEKYLLVPDLGIDKIMAYRFDPASSGNPLQAAAKPFTGIPAGHGPRHLAFHPTGKWVYLMEEMAGAVSAWKYSKGALEPVQEIDAHVPGYAGDRGSADIHVSPDGRYLYASNRGNANNLAIFSIDPGNGKLTSSGFQDVAGKTPRNFIIEPGGNYILVANQGSDNIRIFRRDKATGLLTLTDNSIDIGNPVCLQLLPVKH